MRVSIFLILMMITLTMSAPQFFLSPFQRVTGYFVTKTTPALTVTGKASFYQNPFTGQNPKYKISLTGLKSGDDFYIGLVEYHTANSHVF